MYPYAPSSPHKALSERHAGRVPCEAFRVLPQDLQSCAGRERASLQGDGEGHDEPHGSGELHAPRAAQGSGAAVPARAQHEDNEVHDGQPRGCLRQLLRLMQRQAQGTEDGRAGAQAPLEPAVGDGVPRGSVEEGVHGARQAVHIQDLREAHLQVLRPVPSPLGEARGGRAVRDAGEEPFRFLLRERARRLRTHQEAESHGTCRGR